MPDNDPLVEFRKRADHYRSLARKAEAAAERMTSEGLRAGWLRIAHEWAELSLQVERQHGLSKESTPEPAGAVVRLPRGAWA